MNKTERILLWSLTLIVVVAIFMIPADHGVLEPKLKWVSPDNFGAVANDLIDDTYEFKICIQYAQTYKTPCRIIRGNYMINGDRINYGYEAKIIELDQALKTQQ